MFFSYLSGVKNPAVDEAFLKGTDVKSNFICAFGYADETGIFQRLPRFEYDEACQIVRAAEKELSPDVRLFP